MCEAGVRGGGARGDARGGHGAGSEVEKRRQRGKAERLRRDLLEEGEDVGADEEGVHLEAVVAAVAARVRRREDTVARGEDVARWHTLDLHVLVDPHVA